MLRIALRLFLLLVLGAPFLGSTASAQIFRKHGYVCPPCSTVSKPRRCSTGDELGDLAVHVGGNKSNVVEAFFEEENYFRIEFPETWDLGCGSDIKLAKKNDYGTFAVRFGKCRDRFQVFGWKVGKQKPEETPIIVLEEGYPVTLEWVTSRILKVKYGQGLQKEYVLRFNDADAPAVWTGLHQTDNPASPYDPDGPDSP